MVFNAFEDEDYITSIHKITKCMWAMCLGIVHAPIQNELCQMEVVRMRTHKLNNKQCAQQTIEDTCKMRICQHDASKPYPTIKTMQISDCGRCCFTVWQFYCFQVGNSNSNGQTYTRFDGKINNEHYTF